MADISDIQYRELKNTLSSKEQEYREIREMVTEAAREGDYSENHALDEAQRKCISLGEEIASLKKSIEESTIIKIEHFYEIELEDGIDSGKFRDKEIIILMKTGNKYLDNIVTLDTPLGKYLYSLNIPEGSHIEDSIPETGAKFKATRLPSNDESIKKYTDELRGSKYVNHMITKSRETEI